MRLFSGVVCLCLSAVLWAGSSTYDIEIRGAPIGDVTRFLIGIQGGSVVIPEKLEGEVTASFRTITPKVALDAILGANALGASVENNVFHVMSKTSLQALGKDLKTQSIILKHGKSKAVTDQLKSLLSPRGTAMFDERINSVTIRDTPTYLKAALEFIGKVDIADRQVMIEARVVEVTKNFAQSLGIQWGLNYEGAGLRVGGLQNTGLSEAGRAFHINAPSTKGGGGLGLNIGPFSGMNLDIQLSAGEENGDANILSRPSIVTMNNQPATIRSGQTFFVKTAGNFTIASGEGEAGGSQSNLQQISTGVAMVVTPQITIDNKINLSINVSQSQRDDALAVDGVPGISENMATTNVLLKDGETTVIGGLSQIHDSKKREGLPGFHNIPILGALFGSKTTTNSKRELMIFISPTIVEHTKVSSLNEAEAK